MLFVLLPTFDARTLPIVLRIYLAAGFSLPVYEVVYQGYMDAGISASVVWSWVYFRELIVGFFLFLPSALAFHGIYLGAGLISTGSGSSAVQSQASISGGGSSGSELLVSLAITFMFFTSGCFEVVLSRLYSSYSIFPLFEAPLDYESLIEIVGFSISGFFEVGFSVATPFLIVYLMVDTAFGFASRITPSLQSFFMAMSVKLFLTSILMMVVFAPLMEFARGLFHHL